MDLRDRIAFWIDDHRIGASVALWAGVIVFLLMLAAIFNRADAATLSGSYTLPTTYADGSPLPIANIKHIRVEVGTCGVAGGFGTKETEQLVAPPAATFSITVPRVFGDFCVRAQTETVSGALSVFTPIIKINKPEPNPNPPVLTVATVAYDLRPDAKGKLILGVAVGKVALGVPCANVATIVKAGASYHEVPLSSVQLKKTPRSAIVVASCAAA